MQSIDFSMTHPRFGRYDDCLHDVADDATPEQIEAMKQARFDAWVAFLENPPPPPPEEVSDG